MKILSFAFFNLLLLIGFAQAQKPGDIKQKNTSQLQNQNQIASYSFGVLVAGNLKAQAGDSLDLEAFFRGIKDAYLDKALVMKKEECAGVVQQHVQLFAKRKNERIRKDNQAFLEKNKSDANIKTTASGLQYRIVATGMGKSPGPADKATVHYTGKLVDGTVFDSSVQRGQPATFGVTQVIKGWTEALQMMHEGDKWILYIPHELGYGANGTGQIPPYATLIFEVELIQVN